MKHLDTFLVWSALATSSIATGGLIASAICHLLHY